MDLINYYGFSVDKATGRVYLVKDKTTAFDQGIPHNLDYVTTGNDNGVVLQRTTKVGVDKDNNIVYNDIKGKPYAGKITMYANLPHDELGRLLVDTIGEITSTYKSLGFTANGGVAMDPKGIPDAPKLNNVYPAKESIVLDFDATEGEEAKYYTGYAIGGGKTYKAEVFDPDEDLAIEGLSEGTTYECYVTATSLQGVTSLPSNKISGTCKSVIPAPIFKSLIAGDECATVTYTEISPPEPWTVDHYSYSAINMDDKDAPEIEGHIEDGKIILPNDITWYVRICAVCNPGRVPGDFSDTLTVKPEKPSIPYAPNINTCYVDSSGAITVEWSKGTNGHSQNVSALVVDKWRVKVHSEDGKGTDQSYEYPVARTKTVTDKVSIGIWSVTVEAHNELGWSKPSIPALADYKPNVNDPMIGGQSADDGTYKYCLFYSNATTGYEAIRTKEGEQTTFEVLLVGAGGAGKGQTVTFGKGGNGGGGQLVIGELPPAYAGSVFVTVPSGGQPQGNNPDNTTVKEGSKVLTANASKNATDKNDVVGGAWTEVPKSWQKCKAFMWYEPDSHFVGGVSGDGSSQDFPNGMFYGQAGAGTKDSRAGKGKESFVAIRWKK